MKSINDVIVIGNGILGLSLVYALSSADAGLRVVCVGPKTRPGSATMAAAAMLNSFAEVDSDTLTNAVLRARFDLNRLSNRSTWEDFLAGIEHASGSKITRGFGTYVINNAKAGNLEDRNFDAIVQALDTHGQRYEIVAPTQIPRYSPSSEFRALRSIFLHDEGWVNPIETLHALETALGQRPSVTLIDSTVDTVVLNKEKFKSVRLSDGSVLSAAKVILANGAEMSSLLERSALSNICLKTYFGVGVSALLQTDSITLTNCIRTPNRGLACGLYSAPQSPANTLVGATNTIWDRPRTTPTISNIRTLLTNACTELNSQYSRAHLVRLNVGWRPITEDLMPLIGESQIPGLYILNGMRRDGFHCAPVVSSALSRLIMENLSTPELAPFGIRNSPISIFTREESIDKIVDHKLCGALEHGLRLGDLELDVIANEFRREANEVHDQLGLTETGIHPEFFSYQKMKLGL